MFNNQTAFDLAYLHARTYYNNLSRNLNWLAPIDLRRGWDIYQQARNATAGTLVMGRTCVDAPGRTPGQFGNAITLDDHRGLGVITHRSEAAQLPAMAPWAPSVLQGGMVMHFYGGGTPAGHNGPGADWRAGRSGYHFFYNDCWLLGGAHSLFDFNLASPRRRSNIWAPWGLTATGRELAFLSEHGYRFFKMGFHLDAEVATPPPANRGQARGADFASLVDAVNNYGASQAAADRLIDWSLPNATA